MSATPDSTFTNPERRIADLERQLAQREAELAERTAERDEALEQQTATAEVLGVINSSPGDLTPVFDAMLERAMRLCEADYGHVLTFDGQQFQPVAIQGEARFVEWLRRRGPIAIPAVSDTNASPLARVMLGERVAQVADATEQETYRTHPVYKELVDISGIRSSAAVALRKEDALLGAIVVYRREVRQFSAKEIALLQNFAAQAVIAMENARLITETREALEQQTATAEVLGVINSSPGNLAPVFDAILEKAHALCDAERGALVGYDGEMFRAVATRGMSKSFDEFLRRGFPRVLGGPVGDRLLRGEPVLIPDMSVAAAESPPELARLQRQAAELSGTRTLLMVPLCKDSVLLGYIAAYRTEVRPFTDKQIALLQNFAGQAVIAMENARLLDEIRQRQAELRVTFDNMGDGVVMFDAEHRLAAWNRNFQELLDLPDTVLAERPSYGDYLRLLAGRGEFGTDDVEAELARRLRDTDQELRLERARSDGRVIEVRRNAVPDGGFVLIYSDITERKRSEEEIRAARDAAEAAYRDLQAAQASLVQAQKMAALGQLTAGIAHEIKNPSTTSPVSQMSCLRS